MATTSLIINTKDQADKALTKTITNVNANCASSTLKTVAQMLNGLTSNTYVKTDRVDKSNVDTATDTPKQARSLALRVTQQKSDDPSENGVRPIADDATEFNILNPISNNMLQVWVPHEHLDAVPSITNVSSPEGITLTAYDVDFAITSSSDANGYAMVRSQVGNSQVGSITFTLSIPETMNYLAYSRTLTAHFI